MTPLARGPEKENASKEYGEKPEARKGHYVSRNQPAYGSVYRNTAREQADRIEYWRMENIFGLRAHAVLADIKEISHHKNREDGCLGTDQAVHADASAGRETPVEIAFVEVYRCCAHRLLVPPIRIFRMLEIPQGTAAAYGRNHSV